ncbi:MAG: GNAT family N-acetyltransferase [Pseudorhodobacter sp.]
MTDVTIRPYGTADREACLAIFESNLPKFFDASERAEFCDFLETLPAPATPYLVLCGQGALLGCGGLIIHPTDRQARLEWGMIHAAFHGQRLGTRLTGARLAAVRAIPGLAAITLSTSQHTRGFYEGFGFRATFVTENGFGPGLHRCDMRLLLPAG